MRKARSFARVAGVLGISLSLVLGAAACPEWSTEGTVVRTDLVKGTITIRTRGRRERTFQGTQNQAAFVSPGQRVRFSYSGDRLNDIQGIGWEKREED